MNKYTINKIKGKLSNGKWVNLTKTEKLDGRDYNTDIEICRSDLVFSKDKQKGEIYFLRIEKYESKCPGDKGEMEDDRDVEFSTIEEIIDYLDKNKILKKEEWIVDDKKEQLKPIKKR